MSVGLTIRLLGDLEVLRGDAAVVLPPSKKTRALLGYLIVTGRPHRRDRLCSLFWDVADDPRGALRWSLSKLRALLDEPRAPRIVADRDSVAFSAVSASVDVLELRARLASGPDELPTESLLELAPHFRGELLEGLELGELDDFQAWCLAEREQHRRLHAQLLDALVRRLRDEPERALPFARKLAHVDPLRLSSRVALLELLLTCGRRDEAEQQYRSAVRLLEEAGSKSAGLLRATWSELSKREPVLDVPVGAARGNAESASSPAQADSLDAIPVPRALATSSELAPQRPVPAPLESDVLPASINPPKLAGRRAEHERLVSSLDAVADRSRGRAVLISGEAGIGKSRLLEELLSDARRRKGTVFSVAAFEGDAGRPFGAWVDGLRQLPREALGGALGGALSLLLPELGSSVSGDSTRDRLFGSVLDVVARLAESAPPVVLAFNDVQWSDESSCALLHYVARMNRSRPVLVAMTARMGELADNDAACSLVRGLRRDRMLDELELSPLSASEVAELLSGAVTSGSLERIYDQSAGNPLFALELARAGRLDEGELPRSLTQLVRDRLDRLPPEASDVLRWAAVLGQVLDIDRLAELSSLDPESVIGALETLELHVLLKPSAGGHSFAHEIVRRVVYSGLSEPRRRMMHLRIARLGDPARLDEQSAAEIAHHASLGGDAALAARACVAAGRRCLRLFAGADAEQLARRGLRHVEELAEPERTKLTLELMNIAIEAKRPRDFEDTARDVERLAEHAEALGAVEHARLGFHISSHLRFEGGQSSQARQSTLRAELVSREGDVRQRALAVAEAGRCLAMLERDVGQAEALFEEAGALVSGAEAPLALSFGQGMLRLHQGQYDAAYERLHQALVAARRERDRTSEFQVLEYLVMLELERGEHGRAADLCSQLGVIAEKLREGSEVPFASALEALCRFARSDASALEDVEAALRALRLVDAKQRLVYVLTRLSTFEADAQRAERARVHAREALQLARLLDRPSETALALVALARAARAMGDGAGLTQHLDDLKREALRGVSAYAEAQVERLLQSANESLSEE